MKKVEKLSLLFGIAVVACGVVGTVSISTAVTDEVETVAICGEDGVEGEVTLNSETTTGVCVEAGAQGVVLNLDGEFTVAEGNAIKIGKGATVTLQGSGVISGGTTEIYNEGDLSVDGGIKVSHAGEGAAVVNHGTMNLGRGVMIKQNGEVAAVENGGGEEEAILTINGGSYEGGAYAVENAIGGVLMVNRGTFANNAQAVVKNAGKVEINGGYYSGDYLLDGEETEAAVVVNSGSFEVAELARTEVAAASVKVNDGVFSTGTAELRAAVARGESGKEVYMREDGKFILDMPIAMEVGDVKLRVGGNYNATQNGGDYTYAIANEAVATVDEGGVVTGLKVGQTKLTVASKLAAYDARAGEYAPVTKSAIVRVYQVIGGGSAKSEDGAEVTINFADEFEAQASTEAHLEVTKVNEGGLNGSVGTLLDRVADYKESYDISYILEDGGKLAVSGQKMKIYLKLSDDLMTEDYKYYQVMYIKDDGSIGEVLYAQIEETPDGEKRLAFETTHLSVYAVRASNKPFTNGNTTLGAPFAGTGVDEEETVVVETGEAADDGVVTTVALVGAMVVLVGAVVRIIRRG